MESIRHLEQASDRDLSRHKEDDGAVNVPIVRRRNPDEWI